jgi:hypothetical protein
MVGKAIKDIRALVIGCLATMLALSVSCATEVVTEALPVETGAGSTPISDHPVAVDDTDTVYADTPVVLDVLSNDVNRDGRRMVVTNLTQPANGAATLNPDNTVTYVSRAGFAGTDSFTYTANDGSVDSNVATISARVIGPPIATDIRFIEKSVAAGVDFKHVLNKSTVAAAVGVAAGDYDGDGLLDIYITNPSGANVLYRNNGDGTYRDVAEAAGVAVPTPTGNGAAWADYDNDGDLDLFTAGFGAMSQLFRNDGDGTFSDVTAAAGLDDQHESYRTTGVAWGDYNSDGELDLLVVRHLSEPDRGAFYGGGPVDVVRPLALYRNNGDGTFANVTALLGDSGLSRSNVKGVGFKPAFMDFDNDGDADIYVVNDHGDEYYPNVLWRNNGDGTFTDISLSSGTNIALFGMGLAVGDHDNDGDLDFYFTDIGPSVFLDNRGDGTFANKSVMARTGRGFIEEENRLSYSSGWGAEFADLDNDGFLDLYLVAGYLVGSPLPTAAYEPNAVFLNNGDGTFANVSDQTGADDTGVGRGVVAADFNGDGRIDLFIVNLVHKNGDPGTARLFENVTLNSNSWLSFKLIGTTSNRDGIGARVTVSAGGVTRIREMGASGGHMSASVVPIHFGLGGATVADVVEIRWPSGTLQTLTGVQVNQTLTVTEP